MDTRTGAIIPPERMEEMEKELGAVPSHIKPINSKLSMAQMMRGKIGRNEPCGCGSGKKFKKCCHGRF